MGLYGALWGSTGLYGVLWGTMGRYGVLWGAMGQDRPPRSLIGSRPLRARPPSRDPTPGAVRSL